MSKQKKKTPIIPFIAAIILIGASAYFYGYYNYQNSSGSELNYNQYNEVLLAPLAECPFGATECYGSYDGEQVLDDCCFDNSQDCHQIYIGMLDEKHRYQGVCGLRHKEDCPAERSCVGKDINGGDVLECCKVGEKCNVISGVPLCSKPKPTPGGGNGNTR